MFLYVMVVYLKGVVFLGGVLGLFSLFVIVVFSFFAYELMAEWDAEL